MPKNEVIINRQVVPLHILGDPAYSLSELIVKGYTGRNLSPKEESFNVYHSSARMCVEIPFGKLKLRFRILSKTVDVDTDKFPIIVTACCIFYNMCEDLRIPMPPADPGDDHHRISFPQPQREENMRIDNRGGLEIRTTKLFGGNATFATIFATM